jgi:CspA family cold shock protein
LKRIQLQSHYRAHAGEPGHGPAASTRFTRQVTRANFGQFFQRIYKCPPTARFKRITDKGFGFIVAPDGTEYFFHQSACTSKPFDSLREGENVTFTIGQGPKGPRAENVVPA